MNQAAPWPTSLASAMDGLPSDASSKFMESFWPIWTANGFGTMSKRETDLLLFHCLHMALAGSGTRSNYDWAALLRITPARYRSLRLESHIRFGGLCSAKGESALETFFIDFAEVQTIDVSGIDGGKGVQSVMVSFVVEDPAIQMELDRRLKSEGSFLDFHRNREVVKVQLVSFLQLISKASHRKAIERWAAARSTEGSNSLAAKVRAKKYTDLTEVGKLKLFLDDLAEFAKVKPLTDHLKTIMKSWAERTK